MSYFSKLPYASVLQTVLSPWSTVVLQFLISTFSLLPLNKFRACSLVLELVLFIMVDTFDFYSCKNQLFVAPSFTFYFLFDWIKLLF